MSFMNQEKVFYKDDYRCKFTCTGFSATTLNASSFCDLK